MEKQHLETPLIAYLNINSLRGDKRLLLADVLQSIPIDMVCIDETKLTCDFPDSLFNIEGYQFPSTGEIEMINLLAGEEVK